MTLVPIPCPPLLTCESQVSVQRMEMTDKHVFVQTQIDKGSSLEPQVMTCQQHECVYEHRQEEKTLEPVQLILTCQRSIAPEKQAEYSEVTWREQYRQGSTSS